MEAGALKPSRRHVLKAALVTTVLPRGQGIARPRADQGLKLGLTTYSTRNLTLEQTIALMQRVALRYVSLKDFHLPLTSSAEERRAVAQRLKQAGLTLLGCGVVTMKNDAAEMRRVFDYARDAGIATIVASPDPAAMSTLDQLVAEYDIRIAIHNHGPEDPWYPTPDRAASVIAGHDPRIGLCIDIGHTERAGTNAAEAVQKHASRLYDMHIKDLDRRAADGKVIELGRGVLDIAAVLRALKAAGFAGHVALEYEKDPDDPLPGIAESIGYMRGVLAAMS